MAEYEIYTENSFRKGAVFSVTAKGKTGAQEREALGASRQAIDIAAKSPIGDFV